MRLQNSKFEGIRSSKSHPKKSYFNYHVASIASFWMSRDQSNSAFVSLKSMYSSTLYQSVVSRDFIEIIYDWPRHNESMHHWLGVFGKYNSMSKVGTCRSFYLAVNSVTQNVMDVFGWKFVGQSIGYWCCSGSVSDVAGKTKNYLAVVAICYLRRRLLYT